MEFGRKWSEDKTERKTQGAVAAVEYNPADSCAADRKSTRLNSSHDRQSRMPSSA